MPELPEVEIVKRSLQKSVYLRKILKVKVNNRNLRYKVDKNFEKKLKGKKILITGGAGLIGSNIVKRFIKLGYEVYVADNLWRGKKENLIDGEKE